MKRKKYALIFHIDGQDFSVTFDNKIQTLIYICTLLRRSVGEKMYLHEFYHNGSGAKCKFQRKHTKDWIQKVYETFYPSKTTNFDDWYNKINSSSISQGKSKATKQVETALETQPSAIYFCIINTSQDEFGYSFYNIKISSENIIIPSELQFLLDDLKGLMDLIIIR